MLPVAAAMVMGSLAKTHAAPAAADTSGVAGLLGSSPDQNQDGRVADDVMGTPGKALGGR